MPELPEPSPSDPNQADRARRRAIYLAVGLAVFCATVVPATLTYVFGIPTIGGWGVAVVIYLILNRLFRFDPECPKCGNKVGRSATKCRLCGAALNPR